MERVGGEWEDCDPATSQILGPPNDASPRTCNQKTNISEMIQIGIVDTLLKSENKVSELTSLRLIFF